MFLIARRALTSEAAPQTRTESHFSNLLEKHAIASDERGSPSRPPRIAPLPCASAPLDRPARRSGPSAPESVHQQRGESPRRTEHWLSVAEGNCVVERWGGEQPGCCAFEVIFRASSISREMPPEKRLRRLLLPLQLSSSQLWLPWKPPASFAVRE